MNSESGNSDRRPLLRNLLLAVALRLCVLEFVFIFCDLIVKSEKWYESIIRHFCKGHHLIKSERVNLSIRFQLAKSLQNLNLYTYVQAYQ